MGVAWGLVTVWGQLSARFAQKQPKKPEPTPPASAPTSLVSRRERKRSKAEAALSSSSSGSESAPKQANSRSNIVCRNFAATGSCRFGDRCRYQHIYVPQSFGANTSQFNSTHSSGTTGDSYDSASESDSEDSAASSSAPSRMPAQLLGKYMDQGNKPYGPSPVQTLKDTYLVPPEQVSALLYIITAWVVTLFLLKWLYYPWLNVCITVNRRDCLRLTESPMLRIEVVTL